MEGLDDIIQVFGPDVVGTHQLSEQHFKQRGVKSLEGEKRLMLRVLEDGIETFQKYVRARSERGKMLFQDAEEWILADDEHWLFSYRNICEYLGIYPNRLREGLMAWKKIQLNQQKNGNKSKRSYADNYRSE